MQSVAQSGLTAEVMSELHASAREAHSLGTINDHALSVLRDSGLLAMTVSEQYGGWGFDTSAANCTIEQVARVNPSIAIMLYLHFAVVSRIETYGSERQKAYWLSRITQDRWLAASAWSEPGSSADKRSLSTTATRSLNGNWRINGGKTFATSITVADFMVILAQDRSGTPRVSRETGYGRDDQVLFLISTNSPGVDIPRDAIDMAGMRGSGTGAVQLRDVDADDEAILCLGEKTPMAIGLPHRIGLTLGAVSVGMAQSAYDIALDHVARKKMVRDEAVQRQLARIEINVEAARSMVRVLPHEAKGDPRLAYQVKVFTSTTACEVCLQIKEIIGSAGYLRENDINRISHDADAVVHMGPPNHLCISLLAQKP